jgi:hypothetical protein
MGLWGGGRRSPYGAVNRVHWKTLRVKLSPLPLLEELIWAFVLWQLMILSFRHRLHLSCDDLREGIDELIC